MKPILMNTEMVKAILAGTKTVTRRLIKLQHLRVLDSSYHKEHPEVPDQVLLEKLCEPPYQPDDVLYVRETWTKQQGIYWHKAGLLLDENGKDSHGTVAPEKWRPSIHMPKKAARIFLRVTDVRVERLQDITEEDLTNDFGLCTEAIQAVGRDYLAKAGWNSTIKKSDLDKYGWNANPWVWVIEFERISKEEALKNDK